MPQAAAEVDYENLPSARECPYPSRLLLREGEGERSEDDAQSITAEEVAIRLVTELELEAETLKTTVDEVAKKFAGTSIMGAVGISFSG